MDEQKTAAPAGTPKGGEEVAVDVGAIEKELASLWRESSDSSRAVTRACSWNLIVYASDDDVFTHAKVLADRLALSVPTRSILVQNQPYATGTPVEAWVSANCQLGAGGGKLLCTEEIRIESRGKGAEHVPGLLRALVVTDVPTALWWPGAPPANANALKLLMTGVDRLIVDTANADEGALTRLAHVGGLLEKVTLVDLSWLRTAPLRTLLASLFDPPGGHAPLWDIGRVKIDATSLSSAKLMLGWLASRLKWTVHERIARSTGASWKVLARDEQPITIDVELVASSARLSGLDRFILETNGGDRFGFVAGTGTVVKVEGPGALSRTLNAGALPDEQLLVAALGSRGRDKLSGTALLRAIEFDRPAVH